MRLIDADEFKKQIAGMAIINGYPADKTNKMRELIDCQPTAYDMDKVIEELEEHRIRIMHRKERDILNIVGKTNAKAAVEEDIKIVKAGVKE